MSTNRTGDHPGILQRVVGLLSQHRQLPDTEDSCARSWAIPLKSYQEIPEVYRSFLDALPPSEMDPFPYTALTPTFRGIHHKPEHERLVCKAGDRIHVLERLGDGFAPTTYCLDSISCVELGTILLYSWITVNGCSVDGRPVSSTLMFNSTTDHVMAPFVEHIRSAWRGDGAEIRQGGNRFAYLAAANRKFMSYAERSVPPGEFVIQSIYQPPIRRNLLSLPGFSFSRLISTAHLCILTNDELILIRDDDSQRWLRGSPHGAIWHYVPRSKIRSASIDVNGKDVFTLSLCLFGGFQIESLHHASKRDEVEQLLHGINS